MARIRTIKPEFFTSEDIVALSPMARLLYIACWCEADREGRLEWKPGTMKLRYFPGDNCDIGALATELIDRGLVLPYDVDSRKYAEIPSFAKHQIINNRESASSFPARPGTRQARVKHASQGKEGRKGTDDASSPTLAADPPVCTLTLVDGSEHEVLPDAVQRWAESFPAVDVQQQLLAMRAWLDANPRNRKTAGGIERFVVGWLTKAQNRAPRQAGAVVEDQFAGAI